MNGFEIGPGLSCDIDRLVASRLLVQANSGGGKTRTVRRILEQTHGKVQHLIIDPEGEYSTLREQFDYVIAAPKGGDTAAHPRTAALLAETLLKVGVSAILDIYELNPGDRALFVARFVSALVNADRKLWHPVLVGIDEAHVFAPEGGDSESGKAVAALASRGRKRGYALMAITQRLALLSKTVAAECNNVLIGRCALDVDIKRAADTLGFVGKEERNALRRLEPGQFWAYGAAFGVVQPTLIRVGPVQSRHQEAGQQAAPVPPPTAKVLKLLPQLADLPAEAEAREKTVEDLKRDNANLRRQVTEAQKANTGPKVETKTVDRPVISDAQLERLDRQIAALDTAVSRATAALAKPTAAVQEQINQLAAAVKTVRQPAAPAAPRAIAQNRPVNAVRPPPGKQASAGPGAEGLTGPERRILDAIAWLESIGNQEPEQVAVAFLAGYTYGAGSFNNPRGSLRQAGHVEYLAGNRIRLTESGRALASAQDAPLTTEALHEAVLARLPGPEQRLLRPLLAAYPNAMSNDDLAAASNYQAGAGSFNNPKGRLRTLGLVDYPQPGFAVARSLLFLEA